MARTKIEHLKKDPFGCHIDFIVGIDDNPEEAYNAMMYLRIESSALNEKTGKIKRNKPREIWLSCKEMNKLSKLMSLSSRFWDENTLEKDTSETRKKIKMFKREWKAKKKSLGLD